MRRNDWGTLVDIGCETPGSLVVFGLSGSS